MQRIKKNKGAVLKCMINVIVGPLSVRPRRGKILVLVVVLVVLVVVTIGLSSNSV